MIVTLLRLMERKNAEGHRKSVNLFTKRRTKRTLAVVVDWEMVLKLSLTHDVYLDWIYSSPEWDLVEFHKAVSSNRLSNIKLCSIDRAS